MALQRNMGCRVLVWWEQHYDIEEAIGREKQIKMVEAEMETGAD